MRAQKRGESRLNPTGPARRYTRSRYMPSSPAPDSATPEPPQQKLWAVLRYYIECLCGAFGLPSAIARCTFLNRKHHRDICEWLRPLEALARALIFLEARALTPKAAVETKKRPDAAARSFVKTAFNPDDSDSWRAPFRLTPWPKHAAYLPRKLPLKLQIVPAANAARRIEALVRAYNEREKFAARLARMLARKTALTRFYLKPKRGKERAPARGLWQPAEEALELCRVRPMPARADSS